MSDIKIGHLIRDADFIKAPHEVGARDAVHIAVVGVLAGEDMMPGEEVYFSTATPTVVYLCDDRPGDNPEPVGIVDPFLPGHVKRGQRFWLFMLPGSTQALRHAWTHPAFEKPVVPGVAAAVERAHQTNYNKPVVVDDALDADHDDFCRRSC
jgi:hypothetical protein